MTQETIIKLVDAGFSKDEILKLFGAQEEQKPAPDLEPETPAVPDPVETSASELKQLIANFQDLIQQGVKDLQTANLHSARQPEVRTEKPEDILASIIYPTGGKE